MEYEIRIGNFGGKHYYKKGTKFLHREDGPAIEFNNGDKEWWIDGKWHRTDGPAIEYSTYKVWYFNGEPHRTNGPAIEWTDGTKHWWIGGERLSPEKEMILNLWWENKNGI